MNHRRPLLGTFVAAAWLAACAVPVPPSGGPPDTVPPGLVSSEPADGAVGLRTDRVVLHFDEYVDERSIQAALTITPAQARAPEVRFAGREVELRFREPLRDSTTYILTIDTAFRDAHGVALQAPLRIAFSTGDTIDRGRIAGRVVEWDRGAPAAGIDVFAYDGSATGADAEPSYRTQTDREGTFEFAYLPHRGFAVVAVRDANRNRRIDPTEWVGVSPDSVLVADSAAVPLDRAWVLAPRDAEAPTIRRVDPLTERRLAVRFSEAVRQRPSAVDAWRITDSTGTRSVLVRESLPVPGDPRSLVVVTDRMPAGAWTLFADAVAADSAGNANETWQGGFVASSRPDTVQSRLTALQVDSLAVEGSFRTGEALYVAPWSMPGLSFDPVPARDVLLRALEVTDTTGAPTAFSLTMDADGSWRMAPDNPRIPYLLRWSPSDSLIIPAGTPRAFAPAPESALGELSGAAEPKESSTRVVLVPSTRRGEPERTAATDADGLYRFERLPASYRYRMRVFVDHDGDGRWSPGRPFPWKPAEPIGWLEETPAARARWETVVPDTLRPGSPKAAPRQPSIDRDVPDS